MPPVAWFLLGLVVAAAAAIPGLRAAARRAEHRTRLAERRARQAERLAELGSMTGGLAHEIKNPLSTILLNAQLLSEALRDSALPADERERLARRLDSLAREVERLRGILTDFLQYAGRLRLDPRPVDLGALVEELVDFFLPQCDRAGVVLRTRTATTPVVAVLDEALLKQAILNLMINAVQAMEAAGIVDAKRELMVQVERRDDLAIVHVTDTGPGIDPGRLEDIFRPYVSGRAGGTGLGLPTARRIVEEHGGRIVAHGEPGRGCDFAIELPIAGPPPGT